MQATNHRRALLIAVAAVVVVLVGLGAYLVIERHTSKGGGGHTTGPIATVAKATIHQKSVHVAIDVKSSTGPGEVTQGATGQGDFDLAKNAGELTLTIPGDATPYEFIFSEQTVYTNLGGQVATVLPGKTWISSDILSLGSSSESVGTNVSSFEQLIGNPAALVRQLKGSEAKVVSLGSSTFDGTPVNGYAITLSSKEIEHNVDLVPDAHTTETIYVTSDGLLRAIVIPTKVVMGSQTFTENIYIAFSNYGAPVDVTTPPSEQVATLADYEAGLSAAAGGKPPTS